MTKLSGMTWRHPRGYDPMVETSRKWMQKTGVEIAWDQRSLQDFESFPVKELARQYDLIVIDHPHVGQITDEGCLVALDTPSRRSELDEMSRNSVGPSFKSYNWRGRQWAFPIDAAAQVQAWRPDIMETPLTQWDDVLDMAREGRIVLPLREPHALMCFFTLAANIGTPCAADGGADMIGLDAGVRALDLLAELLPFLDDANFEMDPIAASEAMAAEGSRLAVMPLGYGYVSYSLNGFRPHRLRFANIPVAGTEGPTGSAIGGTGIAVSALRQHADLATDYAFWVASSEVQHTLYPSAGGQPAHAAGWEDDIVNATTRNFYRSTRSTLEHGWLRPRHNGYMTFQQSASRRLTEGLREKHSPRSIIADLNTLFRESF
ncbi:extracellular solute-binding protein [Pelagibacterium sp.]|uniref:extracellular solute-binding protein n=1 Tax=Pelagibacterium sp. TaxID=1967288 RepID=UPI003A91F640